MDMKTGEIYEGTEDDIKDREKALQRALVRLPEDNVEALRILPKDERIRMVNKLVKRRSKNKAARKARRKNRR